MQKTIQIAIEAARAAGAIQRERLGKVRQIDYKSAFNLVTDVDKAAEALIIETITAAFPDDSFLAEESGVTAGNAKKQGKNGSKNRRWIIDPLDGTTNYAHSYPFFCVSIALEENDQVMVGVVYNAVAEELFLAERGQGATLNGEKIKVSSHDELGGSLLATGFPPDTVSNINNNMESFRTLTNLCHGVRRDGSAALDLAFVASGRIDGFWERKLSPWDIAAGALIVEEAGGKVTNLENGTLDMSSGHILATNSRIHSQIVDVLKEIKN